MSQPATDTRPQPTRTPLDRALSLVAEVQPGEGTTAVLMLLNIFVLLVCYAVIKTVGEPLILLGGGAEVRSYAAAGQAVLLMGLVPFYGWIVGRTDRLRLITGITLFFIACIELFAAAVAAKLPYVGVAFFVWVGIFNLSLVAQFWSFANDIYTADAGKRLFPVIVVGMTAGAPLGSMVAGRLFHAGISPQVILQISAALLLLSTALYVAVARRVQRTRTKEPVAVTGQSGFGLVLASAHLRLVAALVLLLNVVNTTGEYLVARLLSEHVATLAQSDPTFDPQAYIGAFTGDYQFWVNVTALALQVFAASRLVRYAGLAGVLLALPLIALGGYALIAAGFGFGVVRWVKTAENATDYSVMNTARQLLWLPTSLEEKYKAKQAIDTFVVRAGDVLSAGAVYMGTQIMTLTPQQFALGNTVLTLVWLAVALRLLTPSRGGRTRMAFRPVTVGAIAALLLAIGAAPADAQDTREARQAAARAEKALHLTPDTPNRLERRLETIDHILSPRTPVFLAMGSSFDGAGMAFGPGYRAHFGDTVSFTGRATVSVRNYRTAEGTLTLPKTWDRLDADVHASWVDAPSVANFGIGAGSSRDGRQDFDLGMTTAGAAARVQGPGHLGVGASFDLLSTDARLGGTTDVGSVIDPTYRKTTVHAEFDSRDARGYARSGSLLRVEWADYHQTNGSEYGFRRLSADAQQLVPLMRENWVLAFRAHVSTTDAGANAQVPLFLMPDLGGSTMLRGFQAWRFRDRNRMLLSGEYRWSAGPLVDMALFMDAGKVTASRADLDLSGLQVSHGIGIRVHTPHATVARVELARSREGTSLVVAFGPSF
jgi:AAA family ATP:ADP antiporter